MKQFDNKEHYLYGSLLNLLREQFEAIEKLSKNELGIWGRYRIQPRGREIGNFIQKIQKHKINKGENNINESIIEDLDLISEGYFPKIYPETIMAKSKEYIINLF